MHHQPRPVGRVGAYGALNTLRALEALAVTPLSAPELAARIGVDDRTARRLLGRLAAEGYAEQGFGHRRRYTATSRLAALGRLLIEASPLVAASRPSLAALAAASGGRADLWIPAAAGGGAVAILTATPAAPPHAHLGRHVPPSHPAALALAGRAAPTAAPILTAQERPVAALTLTATTARAAVATTAATIGEVLRDAVL